MPNTPCLLQCGVVIYSCGKYCSREDIDMIETLMKTTGIYHLSFFEHENLAYCIVCIPWQQVYFLCSILGTSLPKDLCMNLQICSSCYLYLGHVQQVDENQIDSMSALMGCSPAWFFMILEAMSDGGVKNGVPRNVSYTLAAKAMEGAAKMVLETGKHPGEVRLFI